MIPRQSLVMNAIISLIEMHDLMSTVNNSLRPVRLGLLMVFDLCSEYFCVNIFVQT